MTTKTRQVMICAAIVFGMGAEQAGAQGGPHGKAAVNARECVRVATYFHYRELLFRAKAQETIDRYANQLSRYPMATKTVTRAEVVERQYSEYLLKADENARMAAGYDAILLELGMKGWNGSGTVVSVKDLRDSGQLGN